MAKASHASSSSRSPPIFLCFIILSLVRLSGAAYSIISDCDETFNYWEALHLVLYGNGLETWEYSPPFAIRSWAYILLHGAVAGPLKWAGVSKLGIFYGVRYSLALLSAALEAQLISSVSRNISSRCSWLLLAILSTSAGLWSASVAFLPSTFTLYTTTYALASSLSPRPRRESILATTASFALGALLGWPFSLLLSLPWVIERVLLSRHFLAFLRSALLSALIAVPIFIIDSYLYGRPVLVPLNIVAYNVLSGAGPELYGVEPWWFYLANLGLNAGPVVLALSLTAAPAVLVAPSKRQGKTAQHQQQTRLSLLIRTTPLYLWLGLLSTQPHKEERFMFPAYTCLAFNAAVSLDSILTFAASPTRILPQAARNLMARLAPLTATALLAGSALFGLLRGAALVENYTAPMAILPHAKLDALPALSTAPLTVCYGKEWYRFPTSFFIPSDSEHVKWGDVRWVKSEFDGMLPKPYVPASSNRGNHLSRLASSTRAIQGGFNDLNQEDPTAYVDADRECDFLVDSDGGAGQAERRYVLEEEKWERVACLPMLDGAASREAKGGAATTIARTLWMPRAVRNAVGAELVYRDFCVLRNRQREGGSLKL